GYRWVLCDSSYKPANFGVPILANTSGCNPLPGYGVAAAEFSFPTCILVPNDYVAPAYVTDNNNRTTALDTKAHVLAPTYDDPVTRVRNLANSYSSLQVTQFLGFFDENNFPGYTALQENIRSTFPTLASMNINVVPSQNSISCNDATVRADW